MGKKNSNCGGFTTEQLLKELSKRGVLKSICVEKRIAAADMARMPDLQARQLAAKADIATQISQFLVYGKGATFMDANLFTDDRGELYEVELHVVKAAPEIMGVMQ